MANKIPKEIKQTERELPKQLDEEQKEINLEQKVTEMQTPFHRHNGVDAPKLNPNDSLEGFPVFSTVPTHTAPQGTIVLYDNGTDTRSIYAMLGGTWYSVNIT